jgi:hypothetical protein
MKPKSKKKTLKSINSSVLRNQVQQQQHNTPIQQLHEAVNLNFHGKFRKPPVATVAMVTVATVQLHRKRTATRRRRQKATDMTSAGADLQDNEGQQR